MRFERIDIKSYSDEWNSFISPNINLEINNCFIGHNPCLAEIFEEVFGYKAEYYTLIEDNSIIGMLPGFRIKDKFTSIPMFPSAGIFTKPGKDKLTLYKKLPDKMGKYEIRDTVKFSEFVYDEKVLSYLKLERDPDLEWKKLSSDKRNHIRKGYKNGLYVKHGGSELLNDFYCVYSTNMHNLGSPAIEINFFDTLIKKYKNGTAKIFICYYGNIPIGGSVVLSYFNYLEVSWASTLKDFNKLKPNMIMYWEMIKYAIENQMAFFSFGRSTKGSGTHEFKSRWGAKEQQLYFNQSEYSFDIRKLKILSYIWSKLPYAIVKKLGPFMRKLIRI